MWILLLAVLVIVAVLMVLDARARRRLERLGGEPGGGDATPLVDALRRLIRRSRARLEGILRTVTIDPSGRPLLPVACTLGPVDGLQRLEDWRRLSATAGLGRELAGGKLTLRFRDLPGVREESSTGSSPPSVIAAGSSAGRSRPPMPNCTFTSPGNPTS